MKESIILLETAILSKEKGFDWECIWMYEEDGSLQNLIAISSYQLENKSKWFSAPEQALLQKWLREEHHIYVSVERCVIGSDEWEYGYFIEWLPKENHQDKRRSGSFKEKRSFHEGIGTYTGAWYTYEEGLEKGLQEALKLI